MYIRSIARVRRGLAVFALLAVAACDPSAGARETSPGAPVSVVDDTGDTVRLPRPAGRVLSLLPAGTELFHALGAGDRVVGRTRYDRDPWVADRPSVGGGLDPSLEAIVALRPDLVVTWEPAAGPSPIEARLRAMEIPVFSIQTRDTADIYRNIRSLGRLLGRDTAAARLATAVRARLDSVRARVPAGARPTALYVVSLDPPMTAGSGNFLAEMIEVAGGTPLDIAGDAPGLSPVVSIEELVRRDPDVVILPIGESSDMSADRLRAMPGWRDIPAVRDGRIAVVPADLVNRPGPRIPEMAESLRAAIARALRPPAAGAAVP